jgi:hypothetical protein
MRHVAKEVSCYASQLIEYRMAYNVDNLPSLTILWLALPLIWLPVVLVSK